MLSISMSFKIPLSETERAISEAWLAENNIVAYCLLYQIAALQTISLNPKIPVFLKNEH